jgi:hypothetical protein
MILRGQLPAIVVAAELRKTLDLGLRGAQYPVSGAFRLFGEDGKVDSHKDPSVIMAFSPHGAEGDINKNLIARGLLLSRGAYAALQFAISSQEVSRAFLLRTVLELHESGKVNFKALGHTSFAMETWSVLLNMAGFEVQTKGKQKVYVELKDNPWRKAFPSDAAYEEFRKNIFVSGKQYSEHVFQQDGKSLPYNAKMHHKIIILGDDSVVLGTSFNVSDNALTNNEQINIFVHHPELVATANEILDWQIFNSQKTVADTARERNTFKGTGKETKETATDHAEDALAANCKPPLEKARPSIH